MSSKTSLFPERLFEVLHRLCANDAYNQGSCNLPLFFVVHILRSQYLNEGFDTAPKNI